MSNPSNFSFVGLFGISAPFHRPAQQTSLNFANGVLEYSRFHESITIVDFGRSSRGFFFFGSS